MLDTACRGPLWCSHDGAPRLPLRRTPTVVLLLLGILMLRGSFALLTPLMASWAPERLSSRL